MCKCHLTLFALSCRNWGLKNQYRGFSGGTVLKNPPANAGDTGSSPGPGRSHMPRSNWVREPQLLSPRATTTEACVLRARAPHLLKPSHLEPVLCNKRSHHNEKPAHCNEEWPPLATTRESPHTATKTQHSQK